MTTEQRPAHLIDQVMRRCKQQHIELPADGRIQRFIDSVLRQFETQLYASTRDAMDALIRETDELLPVPSAAPTLTNWTLQTIQDMRTDPGRAGLATFLREVAKLRCIRAM